MKKISINYRKASYVLVFAPLFFIVPTFANDFFHNPTPASVIIKSSCSITSTIESPHNETVANGTYRDDIGRTTLKTVCNDANGYAIYAIGYTGDAYAGANHTKLVGVNAANTISTGTATSGNTSSWAIKLGALSSTNAPSITNGFGAYSAIPDNFTKVASYPSSTGVALSSSLYFTYAAFISSTQPADIYSGQVKFVLVQPSSGAPGTYTIAYDPNGGNGTMASDTGVYSFEPYALPYGTFTAPTADYLFDGWCTTNTSSYTCADGELYHTGDGITSLSAAGETVTLFAIWKRNYMHLFASDNAAALSVGETITLIDARDNQEYSVAKLADGKVWMTKNLNLAGGTEIEATMSNVPENYTLSTLHNFQSGNRLPESSIIGFDLMLEAFVYNSGSTACAPTSPCYSYYSWVAATVGSNLDYSDREDAPYSICPKGWKLPAFYNNANGISDYHALIVALGGTPDVLFYYQTFYPQTSYIISTLRSPPYNFVATGVQAPEGHELGGSQGVYWTAGAKPSSNAYRLSIGQSTINLSNYENGQFGLAVRCLFRE